MRIEKLSPLIALIALITFPLYGAEDRFSGTAPGEIRYEASMDWEKGLFTLAASVSIKAEGPMPLARNRAEKKIDDSMPAILKTALAGIRIDTYRFGRDIFYENPESLKRLETVCTPEKKTHSSLSKDMSILTSVYRFPAFPDLMRRIAANTVRLCQRKRPPARSGRGSDAILSFHSRRCAKNPELNANRL